MATRNTVDTSLAGQTGTGKFVGDTAPTMSNATIGNININNNLITSTNANGNIQLNANGTGQVEVDDPGLETGGILVDGASFNTTFRVNDIGGIAPAQMILHKHSTSLEPILLSARSNSNTSAHATVTNGMSVMTIYGTGWLNSYYGTMASITFSADSTGTLADGSAPGRLQFNVTPNGALLPVTAMTINNNGVVTLANALPVGSGGTGLAATTANQLLYSSATNTIAGLASANSATLVTSSAGIPSFTASLTNGQVLIGSTGATPTPAALTAGTGISITNAAGSITIANTAPLSATLPTIQKFTSGSGTYTTPAGVKYIVIQMVGGGGGGSGSSSGAGGGGTGGTGGSSLFGTSLLTCTGGTGGNNASPAVGGAGGTATITLPAFGYSFTGQAGAGATASPLIGQNLVSGTGGSTPFSGGGTSVAAAGAVVAGKTAVTNTGSGGSGGAASAGAGAAFQGGGGGAAAYVNAFISSPSATYSYTVGAAGTAGTAGTAGAAGGAGAAGIIIVYEYYN